MKNRQKIHINAVDITVIILMILAAVFAVHRYYPHSAGVETKQISYCLRTDGLSPSLWEKISVGDKVFNFDDGSQIGTVSDLSSTPPGDGTPPYDDYPSDSSPSEDGDGQHLYITVSASAEIGTGGFLVNGTSIGAGNTLKLRLPNLYCDAECISAEESAK